ncbi:MAG: hypothetical protein IJI52_05880, partial [Solobacterium sp.]|nr:hypothetical protein [Solobacterium sp.]
MNNRIEINENTLHKTFRDRICFDHERTIYHFLTDTGLAPELLDRHGMTLLARYIDAPSLADVLSGGTMPAGLEDALLRWQTGFLDRCH